MDNHLKETLNACLAGYAEHAEIPITTLQGALTDVFAAEQPFLDKVVALDAAFDDAPRFEALREVTFDLLLMNFFAVDAEKLEGDYLESDEWEAIEEQTIDRGTELLNLLLYLRECADEAIDPQLADYLKEFLLVDEDEFQDEYRIYEPAIANQLLMDSTYGEIAKVAETVSEDDELAELFYPVMGFFYNSSPDAEERGEYIRGSKNPAFDAAIYNLLTTYHRH